MTEFRALDPHDPLPGGESVVLLRRFAEAAPNRVMIELVVSSRAGGEKASVPVGPDGAPLEWEAAHRSAADAAERAGIATVWTLDRLAGRLEREVTEDAGDRSLEGEVLTDTDPEDGEVGPDLRDQPTRTAPRRF